MPDINWDPTAEPLWLPKIDNRPFPSLPEIYPWAQEADRALGHFVDAMKYLGAQRNELGFPVDTYFAQAIIAAFKRVAEASGADLRDLAILNPFADPLPCDTFEKAVDRTYHDRIESANVAANTHAVWARAKAFGHAGFPQSPDETDPVGS